MKWWSCHNMKWWCTFCTKFCEYSQRVILESWDNHSKFLSSFGILRIKPMGWSTTWLGSGFHVFRSNIIRPMHCLIDTTMTLSLGQQLLFIWCANLALNQKCGIHSTSYKSLDSTPLGLTSLSQHNVWSIQLWPCHWVNNFSYTLCQPNAFWPGMIESRDSQQILNETSPFQYCLSHF